jgi:hypothetical protein
MGWKTINGRQYYYKSKRRGGRVETTYLGGAEFGLLLSLFDSEAREERDAKRAERRAEREEYEREESNTAEWFDGLQTVADTAIVAAGFHKHKGQ